MQPLPHRCPLCSGATHVERIRCDECGTALEGQFAHDWPGALGREQLAFVKVFLTCRGKIKDVEQALGLSYPTVVSRLDEVVQAVLDGRPPAPRATAPAARPSSPERTKILDDLASGAIDAEEAARRLRNT